MGDEAEEKVQLKLNTRIPQFDVFERGTPAFQFGSSEPWEVTRTVIDFGGVLLMTGGTIREGKRMRDAVFIAILRRALVVSEGILNLLAAGLEEPAQALTRTLLDIELNAKLLRQEEGERLALRLAAFHYANAQQHQEEILSDRETREGTLGSKRAIDEVIASAKRFAAMLYDEAFAGVRDELLASHHWHGLQNAEAAFKAVGEPSDYFMSYDLATPFVHAVNVDRDFVGTDGTNLQIRPAVQRDPKANRIHLAHLALRLFSVIKLYIEERGLPEDDAFKLKSKVTAPDGASREVGVVEALNLQILAAFPSEQS